jgi:DNA-binding MarR family transcriptional regulator
MYTIQVPPSKKDVQSMVAALFTMNAGLERARRQRKGASTLSLLQVIADHPGIRPSEITDLQQVHPSLVTRQVRELEDAGYVTVNPDPADRRSRRVTLTPRGSDEQHRLVEFGLKRFALFVQDWDPDQVRTLALLLWKLQGSMATVSDGEQRRSTGLRWVHSESNLAEEE